MNKIWVPNGLKETNVPGKAFDIAWSQEDRDRVVASWGIQKPYTLFARHPNMGNHLGLRFPLPGNQRFTEMAVYGQVQEALMLTVRMSDSELDNAIRTTHVHYERQIEAWNIKVPSEALGDMW